MKTTKWFLTFLLFAGVAVAGPVYKWKDADGRVYYSDTPPPPGSKVTLLPLQSGEQAAPPVSAPRNPPAADRSPPPAEASATAVQAGAQKDPKLCQQARARKAYLESGQMLKSVNEKGEVEFLNPEKRAAEIVEAGKAIERHCP